MGTTNRLEAYLSRMEKLLGPISPSEKAEIIMEIKSHVMDAQAQDQSQSIDSVLKSLGEPEFVANRYLLERGLKPKKFPKHPILKWLVIGFLGTFGIIVFFVSFVIWKFTPLVKVDKDNKHISILGGTIDVHGDFDKNFEESLDDFNIAIHSARVGEDEKLVKGLAVLGPEVTQLAVHFSHGKLEVKNSGTRELSWDCVINKDAKEPSSTQEGPLYTFDARPSVGSNCELSIPAELKMLLEGQNGKIEIHEPHNAIDASLENGKISFKPDGAVDYRFNTSVKMGATDDFTSSSNPQAYPINLSLLRGKIGND